MKNAWHTIVHKISDFEIRRGITSFVNPYSMLQLEQRNDIANGVDCWCVDGISLVKLLKKKFGVSVERYSFDDTSVAPIVFEFAKRNSMKIGLIGTKPGVIEQSVQALRKKFQIEIEYFRNGYFEPHEIQSCYDAIIKAKLDIVVCGMGTPYQEEFLLGLHKSGWNGYGFTCGGYLHQVAAKEIYYPAFFDKLNIRWIYRIIDEPKLIKRYFILYPKFLFKLIKFNKK